MIENRERQPRKLNLMTRETYNRLLRELESAEQALAQSSKDIGDAAGESHEWHDNAAYDQAKRDTQINAAFVLNLRQSVTDPVFIEPRQEVDRVGLGNTVGVLFQGEDEPEEYTVLGKYDSGTNKSWISYESPLGEKLLGKKPGDRIEYEVKNAKVQAKVVSISPGKFSKE